ncbi:hypothetical protein [Thermococcus piezophilus]|uniref:Uncharacterized protein n=1 Tax=Thermococcus piezophilus TaxID=1712654 RepID=A0A172WFJ8_9EURY|nr:hypothetical protein [Thermococcus piezophilus]ANF22149.1 hypothetical protein A7C91_02305 [Thermococcus piezophilus]
MESEALEFLRKIVEKYKVRALFDPEKKIGAYWNIIDKIDYMFESPVATDIGKFWNSYFLIDRKGQRFSLIQIVLEQVEVVERRRFFWNKTILPKHRYFIRIHEAYFKSSLVADVLREVVEVVEKKK